MQIELFTAFLWLAEFVIIFIIILLFFYLNVYGNINMKNKFYFNFKNLSIILVFVLISYHYNFISEIEFFIPIEMNSIILWDNFYETIPNNITTDLFGLFITYYYINSFEFISVGLILLIGSLVCVNLNKIVRINKVNYNYNFFILFDFFKDFSKFLFLKKQNLIIQANSVPSIRIFKKK
jgi:hypothetical protein